MNKIKLIPICLMLSYCSFGFAELPSGEHSIECESRDFFIQENLEQSITICEKYVEKDLEVLSYKDIEITTYETIKGRKVPISKSNVNKVLVKKQKFGCTK